MCIHLLGDGVGEGSWRNEGHEGSEKGSCQPRNNKGQTYKRKESCAGERSRQAAASCQSCGGEGRQLGCLLDGGRGCKSSTEDGGSRQGSRQGNQGCDLSLLQKSRFTVSMFLVFVCFFLCLHSFCILWHLFGIVLVNYVFKFVNQYLGIILLRLRQCRRPFTFSL